MADRYDCGMAVVYDWWCDRNITSGMRKGNDRRYKRDVTLAITGMTGVGLPGV